MTVRYYDPTGLVRCVRFDCTAEKMEDVFRECRTEGYIPLVEDLVVLAPLDDREFVRTIMCSRADFVTEVNVRVDCRRESLFGRTPHGRATDQWWENTLWGVLPASLCHTRRTVGRLASALNRHLVLPNRDVIRRHVLVALLRRDMEFLLIMQDKSLGLVSTVGRGGAGRDHTWSGSRSLGPARRRYARGVGVRGLPAGFPASALASTAWVVQTTRQTHRPPTEKVSRIDNILVAEFTD